VSDEPQKVITQRGLWFEEFEPGVRYLHRPGRTITEADNVLFTTLTMKTQAPPACSSTSTMSGPARTGWSPATPSWRPPG
jgi:hypothetical protein